MKIIADLHTHSIASTHAYATITEMLRSASDKGLYALGITDHGRALIGAPGPLYFENLYKLPKSMFGVRFIKGIEANIIDYDGTLDASEQLLKKLDFTVASMHGITLTDKPSVDKCTQAYLAVCDNPCVNALGHSGSQYFLYDHETVIKRCAQTGTLIEINSGSFTLRKDNIENCKNIIELCKKHDVRVIVNSDAHFTDRVGDFDLAIQMLCELSFPPELVVNSSIDRLNEYFKHANIEI